MLRTEFELLGHIGDDIRLADRLSAGDRQRVVGVGAVDELRIDEVLARHLVHGAQHRLIADAAPAQRELKLHPFDIGGGNPGHGDLAL